MENSNKEFIQKLTPNCEKSKFLANDLQFSPQNLSQTYCSISFSWLLH